MTSELSARSSKRWSLESTHKLHSNTSRSHRLRYQRRQSRSMRIKKWLGLKVTLSQNHLIWDHKLNSMWWGQIRRGEVKEVLFWTTRQIELRANTIKIWPMSLSTFTKITVSRLATFRNLFKRLITSDTEDPSAKVLATSTSDHRNTTELIQQTHRI